MRSSRIFLEPRERPPKNRSDPPRTLHSLAKIIEDDLCHRCGSCIGICPSTVLGADEEGYPAVERLSSCTDCDLCVKVCPGNEFHAERIARRIFGHVPPHTDAHGYIRKACLAYAADKELRQRSTSGGLVTALLVHLLREARIDGAIVVADDEKNKWKGRAIIATTAEEIIAAGKSKYGIVPTNTALSRLHELPGRYALVGLPCQIQGFEKAGELSRALREKVVLTIGLFCHAAVEHEPLKYLWERVEDPDKVQQFISRVGKHPGTAFVRYHDGAMVPLYFPAARGYRPNSTEVLSVLYRLYTPLRCLMCYDATSEFADIAAGDPWMVPPDEKINFQEGYTCAFIRTKRGEEAMNVACNGGAVVVQELESAFARTSNAVMVWEKRWRAYNLIARRRRRGQPVPKYDFALPKPSSLEAPAACINLLLHIFCFLPRARRRVLKFLFSPCGYAVFWLNHQKRKLRNRRQKFCSRLHFERAPAKT